MAKQITSDEFDELFDSGADMAEYLDFDAATIEEPAHRDVLLSLPDWALKVAEREAKRRNVPRRALLNIWITDKADEIRSVGMA